MSILTRALGVVILCCAAYVAVSAQTAFHADLRARVSSVNAQSAIVMDADSAEILWSQNADTTRPIASLTKLMTAAVVMDSGLALDHIVKIAPSDVRRASTTYLRSNDRVSVETLLYLMMVGSDNAAARALARTVSTPKEFVKSMNGLARKLELTHTIYAEPSGLNASNRASAQDIAKLVVYAKERSQAVLMDLLNTPIFQSRIGTRTVVVSNTNRFMDDATLATKTGYTAAAKYCLTMLVTDKDGHQYVIVVLGAPTSKERFDIGEMFQRLLTEPDEPHVEQDDPCGPVPEFISDAGKDFIREHEKLTLKAYYDKNGYAIGYGMHTWQERKVTRTYPGRVTQAQVEAEFDRQLQEYVLFVKTRVCAPMTQPMLDSLVSVAWNLGRVNTAILRKMDSNRPIVAADFLTTATVRRRPYPMLINRRLREYLLFTGDYDAAMDENTVQGLRQLTRGRQVVLGS
jgi:D-alanyl-D-alanine carboxypeptidase/GH24 family phage-related lysozyme (muramidase)